MSFAFFAEMAWKSALIAGAALLLASVLRSRAAADRALVLRVGVALLLALPVIALGLPALEIVAFAAPEAPAPFLLLPAAAELSALAAPGLQPVEPTIWDDPTPLVILAYLGGVAMAGSRLLAGLWTLRRWTRAGEAVACPEWLRAFDRVRWAAGDGERIRLIVSDAVPSPLSWGWRNPAILIDPDTLAQPGEAEAILAHEVAHVARRDWPVLMMTRLAAALFWFNPLVWLLEREVVQQAEEAADREAAERVEPARYAETLLGWAQANAALPANSIAPSARALARRIRAVLDRRQRERPSGSAWTALAMLACIGIAAPVAAMELVAAAREAPEAPLTDAEIALAASAADEALAEVLPRIPEIVASASAAMHPHEAERALEEARRAVQAGQAVDRAELREAMRQARAAIAAGQAEHGRAMAQAQARFQAIPRGEIERAMREARAAIAESRVEHAEAMAEAQARFRAIPRGEIDRAMREARVAIAQAPRIAIAQAPRVAERVRVSMAHGAEGMLRGADGMEAGARRMEEEARRLRSDRAYRERQIERARERGEEVTHDDLIEAADGMMEGAQGMREGARGMREAARSMRDGDD